VTKGIWVNHFVIENSVMSLRQDHSAAAKLSAGSAEWGSKITDYGTHTNGTRNFFLSLTYASKIIFGSCRIVNPFGISQSSQLLNKPLIQPETICTLCVASCYQATMDASSLCNTISSSPHGFLVPSNELHLTSRIATKNFLDPLASNLTTLQDRWQKSQKNGRRDKKYSTTNRFRVQKLYLDGFSVGQVWEQVVRIIDETNDQLSNDIEETAKSLQKSVVGKGRLHSPQSVASDQDDSALEDEVSQSDLRSQSEIEDLKSEGMEEDMEEDDVEEGFEDELDDESNADLEERSSVSEDATSETYVEDKFGLNDGFFSIDDFNKQSEFFERMDERGDQDELSDGEDIDWHADPASATVPTARPSKLDKLAEDEDEIEDSEDSDAGPTFGDAGFADDDSDEELEDDAMGADWLDTNDIKYDDFFAPPPRKVSKKKARLLPKTQPTAAPTDDDVERAISDVRRDLFENFSDEADSDVDMDAEDAEGGRSTHEKQKAKIADEIRRLEMANVAKKEWMLAGEARAPQRPLNSLIEEDLEFERVGKPVPVVTNETSEEIEQLIKRRIIAKEFDEVVRRLPDSIRQHDISRGRVEVDQTKPQQSLAELYENEHLRATDPSYVDQKNEKLKKEHAEIAQLWKSTSSQLDALSNWHYKPSVPQPNINVITDVATVMMEDARPGGSAVVGEQGTLAPQEVYHPKDAAGFGGEVALKNGVSIAKDEMSREEKTRRRRNEKKKFKATSQQPGKQKKTDEGQQILSDLKKGGVQMVGQGGELQSLNERRKSGNVATTQSDSLKL
jgi:U3 small nucleolar RNA-associated protein MPP10